MRTSRIPFLTLVTAAMSVVSVPALAQVPAASAVPSSSAGAKDLPELVSSLNSEAVARMMSGDFAAACPKLEEAVRLAPEAAIGARLNLADCYARTGKAPAAYTQYSVAGALAERAGQHERAQVAKEGMKGQQPTAGVLKLDFSAATASLPGLIITLDGVAMPELRWVETIGLAAGAHTVEVSAPGYVSRLVQVQGPDPGKISSLTIPTLDRAEPEPEATATRDKSLSGGRATPVGGRRAAPEPRSKAPGIAGLAAGGTVLVAGAALLGGALAEETALIKDTPKDSAGNLKCSRTGWAGEDTRCAAIRSRADSGSVIGNAGIGLIIGGGVIAAASVVYLLLPPGEVGAGNMASRVFPLVGQGGGGVVWVGSF